MLGGRPRGIPGCGTRLGRVGSVAPWPVAPAARWEAEGLQAEAYAAAARAREAARVERARRLAGAQQMRI
eukprot:15483223-Alexandrium_andersonii.AAC.1